MKYSTIRTYLIGLLMVIFIAGSTFAADVVKTKAGKTYEGHIVTQNDDYIEIVVKVGTIDQRIVVMRGNIASITLDGDASQSGNGPDDKSGVTDVKGDATGEASSAMAHAAIGSGDVAGASSTESPNTSGVKRKCVYVIPLEDEVGKVFRVDKLKEAIDAGRPYNPDIIVLRIDSPGGLLSEIYKLRDYLQKERNEFHIVVWIKSAISAAAMTSFNVREMYFMKEGHIGAATAFNPGNGQALQGDELAEWIKTARDMFTSAGWDPKIAQTMIDEQYWLTADVIYDANGKKTVIWHDDDSGSEVLSRPGENLVFTSTQALQFNIANAICDDEDELAEALHLEDGWYECSDAGRKIMEDWKNLLKRADKEIPKLNRRYQAAQSMSDPRAALGQQAQVLRELIKWGKRMPTDVFNIFYQLDVKQLERQLRLIRSQIANLNDGG